MSNVFLYQGAKLYNISKSAIHKVVCRLATACLLLYTDIWLIIAGCLLTAKLLVLILLRAYTRVLKKDWPFEIRVEAVLKSASQILIARYGYHGWVGRCSWYALLSSWTYR